MFYVTLLHRVSYTYELIPSLKMFDVLWMMDDVILPHPASCIGELTLSLKMFDVLWMMDDVIPLHPTFYSDV